MITSHTALYFVFSDSRHWGMRSQKGSVIEAERLMEHMEI